MASLAPIGSVIVNGELSSAAEAAVRVDDIGLLRGYGCFEALRAYGGVPFRLGQHLDRLEVSAAALLLPLPSRALLEEWCRHRAAEGDVVIRVVVTGGVDVEILGTESVTLVFAHEASARPEAIRLLELVAPWHPAGVSTELAGAKTLSYAPNTAALIAARNAGYDDALLVDPGHIVLELPMASIGWVVDGVIETPSLDLGILRSITRRAMLEVAAQQGRSFTEGVFPSSCLEAADEVFVMSTTKEIAPVVAVGGRSYEPGPVTEALAAGFGDLVAGEVAAGTT